MAPNYALPIKSQRMQVVVNAIDSAGTAGTIEIGTAAMGTILCIISLSKPSFTELNGVLTMASVPKTGTASVTGTGVAARIKDGGGGVQVSGLTVGTAGADINLDNNAIIAGQTVTLSSGTISHF
jgi:hypothetical protein